MADGNTEDSKLSDSSIPQIECALDIFLTQTLIFTVFPNILMFSKYLLPSF
jgi:hypothetical protein